MQLQLAPRGWDACWRVSWGHSRLGQLVRDEKCHDLVNGPDECGSRITTTRANLH